MTHHITPRRSTARSIRIATGLLLGFTSLACNAAADTKAYLTDRSMLDIEFDTAGKLSRYAYCQPDNYPGGTGTLFTGTMGSLGNLSTPDNRGSCAFLGSGPEWGQDSAGTFIAYLDYDTSNNLIVRYIYPDISWTPILVEDLPTLATPGNVVFASQYDQSGARVVFMAQAPLASNGILTTQGLTEEDTFRCQPLTQGLTGNFPRFSSYENFLMLTKKVTQNGPRQVYKVDMSDCSLDGPLLNDTLDKTTATAWHAPEIDGDVYGVLIGDNGVADTYNVYDASSGVQLASFTTPGGEAINSPETFQYNGHSYLLYAIKVTGDPGNTAIWVANLHVGTSNGAVAQQMSGDQSMLRFEPEVGFLPNGTPRIYFSVSGSTPDLLYKTAVTSLP